MSIQPIPVEIRSHGSTMHAGLYTAEGEWPAPTVLLVPGWPCSVDDDFGLAGRLAVQGVNTLILCPRGFAPSEGEMTFAHTLDDIGETVSWLLNDAPDAHRTDPARLILGGYDFGGGVALAYAARDASIQKAFSIAGTDHAEMVRRSAHDPAFGDMVRARLCKTAKPKGPVTFRIERIWVELEDHPELFGLRENAGALAERSLLLIGGWRDRNVSVDDFVLPLYRALERAGGEDTVIQVYPDDHSFSRVRRQLLSDISDWITRRLASAATRFPR